MITIAPSTDERGLLVMEVHGAEDSSKITWISPTSATVEAVGGRLYISALNSKSLGSYVAVDRSTAPPTPHFYRLSEEREAVVAVHGIGEQVEFSHATTYANALRRPLGEIYETPFEIDETSGTRTRQFTLVWRPFRIREHEGGGAIIKTDVYEHYWQPLLSEAIAELQEEMDPDEYSTAYARGTSRPFDVAVKQLLDSLDDGYMAGW